MRLWVGHRRLVLVTLFREHYEGFFLKCQTEGSLGNLIWQILRRNQWRIFYYYLGKKTWVFFPPFTQQLYSESCHEIKLFFFPNTWTNQDGMIFLDCEHSSDHVVIKLTETDRWWLNDTCHGNRMKRWTNMQGREKDESAALRHLLLGWMEGHLKRDDLMKTCTPFKRRPRRKMEKKSKKMEVVGGNFSEMQVMIRSTFILVFFFLFATSHKGLLLYPPQSCSGTYGGCHSTPQPITLPVRWIHPLPRAAIHIKTSKGYERKSAY